MNINYTTIEQSRKLLELGLNPDSADMYYEIDPDSGYIVGVIQDSGAIYRHFRDNSDGCDCIFLPCWSTGRLIELLPKSIGVYNRVIWMNFVNYETSYSCLIEFVNHNLMDNLIEAIEWAIKNNYIKYDD